MVSRAALTSLALLLAVASASAQYRPSYAANGFAYPRPFIGGGEETNTNDDGLGNRFANDNANVPTKDELGFDTAIVQAANNYPEAHKPFWLLNRDHIMTHIGLNPQNGGNQNRPAQPSQAQPGQTQPGQAQPSLIQPSQIQPSQVLSSRNQPGQARPTFIRPSQESDAVGRPPQVVRPFRPSRPVQPAQAQPTQLDELEQPEQPEEPTIFDLATGAQNNGPSPSSP